MPSFVQRAPFRRPWSQKKLWKKIFGGLKIKILEPFEMKIGKKEMEKGEEKFGWKKKREKTKLF